MKIKTFQNRSQGGQLLADALKHYAGRDDVIVLGLPRGGVPVAYEVAVGLHAPLDVMVVRKLGVPGWEELAMGAIASGGVQVLNDDVVRSAMVSEQEIKAAAEVQWEELHRRENAYRGHAGTPDVKEKIVILVDDGIATGATIRAAIQSLRKQNSQKIVIAVPVASSEACTLLKPLVNEFVCLLVPKEFRAVGQWYQDFSQTSDSDVARVLAKAAALEPVPRLRP